MEVERLTHAISPSTDKPYGVVRVCEEMGVSRATLHRHRQQAELSFPKPSKKRGPNTAYTDEQLTEHIRQVLADSPFTGEGYRKVWARLRLEEIRTSKKRVLRLMREANLLAPQRGRRVLDPRVHDGTVIPEAPNEMWGTDATSAFTAKDGWVTVFIAVDHFTAECVGTHAAKPGTGFEALEPLRQGMRARFGGFDNDVAPSVTTTARST